MYAHTHTHMLRPTANNCIENEKLISDIMLVNIYTHTSKRRHGACSSCRRHSTPPPLLQPSCGLLSSPVVVVVVARASHVKIPFFSFPSQPLSNCWGQGMASRGCHSVPPHPRTLPAPFPFLLALFFVFFPLLVLLIFRYAVIAGG